MGRMRCSWRGRGNASRREMGRVVSAVVWNEVCGGGGM